MLRALLKTAKRARGGGVVFKMNDEPLGVTSPSLSDNFWEGGGGVRVRWVVVSCFRKLCAKFIQKNLSNSSRNQLIKYRVSPKKGEADFFLGRPGTQTFSQITRQGRPLRAHCGTAQRLEQIDVSRVC